MKKSILVLFFMFFTGIPVLLAQTPDETHDNKKNDQEALDQSMLSPEQKKQMKKYEKKIKKTKKEKEKKNNVTRKQAEKKNAARINKTNSKTRQKKKRYVKTH